MVEKQSSWTRRLVRGAGYTVSGLMALAVAAAAVGYVAQSVLTAQDRKNYPPLGIMVDIGGRALHLYCTGDPNAAGPTIVLEAGAYGSSLTWFRIQPVLAERYRVCSYDRAGFGWSEAAPDERSLALDAEDARRMLDASDESGPYLLVGMSYGGVIVRQFHQDYPDLVAGLVFVDPTRLEARRTMTEERKERRRKAIAARHLQAWLSQFGVWRLVAASRRAAPSDMSADLFARFKAVRSSTRYFRARAKTTERLFRDLEQPGLLDDQDFGDLPITVLSENSEPGTPDMLEKHGHHRTLAERSTNRRHYIVDGATHRSFLAEQKDARVVNRAVSQLWQIINETQAGP